MGLRCFLFSSDEAAAETIRQVLADLDVEVDSCSEAVAAVDSIANQSFQIVIIDWDKQPEAGLLLSTARERKAAERPITLAIVSSDPSVPKALQAGANSILRKPILTNQVKDTLKTARDLLRSKREPSSTSIVAPKANAMAAAAAAPATIPASMEPGKEKTLRAGEFLQSAPATPGGSFVTESDVPSSAEQVTPEPVDPLKDLEPVAASVAEQKPEPVAPPQDEPRGLEWYIKSRGGRQSFPAAPAKEQQGAPQLLGFEQMASPAPAAAEPESKAAPKANPPSVHEERREQKKEAALFSYIDKGHTGEPEEAPRPRFRLGKGPIVFALLLAAGAILAAPQAPWHPKMRILWAKGQHALHAWLNPQPVTPAQAPVSHENFGRAGDEYKLPAAESIPDATTDPSQIKVLPVIDPTAKKPTTDPGTADPSAVPADGSNPAPTGGTQSPDVQPSVQPTESQPQASAAPVQPGSTSPSTTPSTTIIAVPVVNTPPHVDAPPAAVAPPATSNPAPVRTQQPRAATIPGNIPSSLKSQLASSTPDASGSKSPEAALPSIEPVVVTEAAERSLLLEQPALAYPANAKGQQGTVILQVLIGRDGTVQDAKFLQGSLAFARSAIEGVKQWKFKPYSMNGRAVSVQTSLTLSFKPGQ